MCEIYIIQHQTLVHQISRNVYPPKAAYFSVISTFMHIMLPDLQTGHVNVTESSTFRSAFSHEIQCKVAIPVEAHVTRDLALAANAK